MQVTLEITSPDGPVNTVVVDRRVELGHAGTDVVLDDPSVSRRHVAVEIVGDRVVVSDLGSSNGTRLNGVNVTGEVAVDDGALLTFGDSRVLIRIERAEAAAAVVRPAVVAPTLTTISRDLVEVRFLPGTAGADAAPSVLDTARRARKALAGIGSEAWGTPVGINLVDPFVDPSDPDRVVSTGTVVDTAAGNVWMAVTPEARPEDPHRPLALLFGAALPAATEVAYLIEGYGLHLAGAAEPAPATVESLAGPVADLEPNLRTAVAGSFVRYLIAREGEPTFRQLLAAPAGRLAETFARLYGMSSTAMEMRWRGERSVEKSTADTRQFLKLSWKYLRPYRLMQAEVFVYMLFSLAFTASFPFVTKRLFDTAIPSGEFSQVLSLLAILGGAFVISMVAGLRQNYQSGRISGSVTRDMQAEIFARLQALPDSWVSRHSQGDVLSRMMNDVGRVQGGLATAIDGGIFQVVSLIVSTVIMLRVNVPLGLIVLVVAPIVAIVYRLMSSGARSRSIAVQEDSSSLMQVASENYQANAVVKLFRLAGHERGRFARTAERLLKSQMRLSLFGGLFGVAVNGIVTILRLIVLGFGTWLVFEGHFTVGGLVAFLGIMGEVLSPVTGLTTLGQTIQSSMGALVRIDEILDAPTEPSGADLPALAPIRREITLENVALSYTAERRALDGVDVQIPAGSRVAFVGPSGSGKSTVLRVLMRLYEPDEGTLRVDGVDVATRSLESLRAQMGVVFQDSFLFDATVRENIGFGKIGATEAEILAAAKAAEVDSFIDMLARGYDTMVGEGGRHLSGGQRQRVAIARALVGNPAILLLDEATSALDPKTERQIIDTLKKAGEGRSVVAITHRLTSIIDYDRIVMIVEGRVVETGTHEELVRLGGAYARQWAEQTGEAMPPAPAFDAAAALRRIALFRELSDAEISDVVDRLRERTIPAGEVMREGGDRVVIIRSGRAEILGSTISGERVVVRSVGAGEVFGLSALLGTPTGAQLRATEPVVALELDGEDVAALTRRHPTIAQARAGRGTLLGPATGTRLTSAGAAGTSASASLTAGDIRAAAARANIPMSAPLSGTADSVTRS